MTIKRLGLAAILAMVFAAFPASALGTIWPNPGPEETTLHGEGSGGLDLTFADETWTSPVHCESPAFTAPLWGPSKWVTTTSVSDCTRGEYSPVFEMHGCQLKLDPESSTVSIVPSGCGPIIARSTMCEYSIDPQTLPATFTNFGSGETAGFTVEVDTDGVDFTLVSKLGCGQPGPRENGHLRVSWDVTGTAPLWWNSEPVGVHANDVPVELSVATQGSGEPELESVGEIADATSGDIDLVGTSAPGGQQIVIQSEEEEVNARCSSSTFDGGAFYGRTSDLSLDMSPDGCESNIGETMIQMNSCSYELSGNLEGEWDAGIGCEEPGDSIAVEIDGVCTVTIPAQQFDTPAELTNQEDGTVNASVYSQGVDFDKTGPFCFLWPGSEENGIVDLDIALSGSTDGV